MPGNTGANPASLAAALRAQDNVISRRQALAGGLTRDALAHRIRPGGPWQRIFPGVYVAHSGFPTIEQKDMAALLYAGPGSMLTGTAALRDLGVISAEPSHFDVLVPISRRPRSIPVITIHRTTRMPGQFIEGKRSYALVYRALADAARGMDDSARFGPSLRGPCSGVPARCR
jgi:hypothetical protein